MWGCTRRDRDGSECATHQLRCAIPQSRYAMYQPGYPKYQPRYAIYQPRYPTYQPSYPMYQRRYTTYQPRYVMCQCRGVLSHPRYAAYQHRYITHQPKHATLELGDIGWRTQNSTPPPTPRNAFHLWRSGQFCAGPCVESLEHGQPASAASSTPAPTSHCFGCIRNAGPPKPCSEDGSRPSCQSNSS